MARRLVLAKLDLLRGMALREAATGLGATLVGVATLPFDRGKTLWAGLKGVMFSLPELVFFNIRKGSFDYIEDDRRLK